jgi:TNF receptor-associated protein 1
VLFLYEPYDELVLMQLGQFDRKYLKSIENEVQESKEDTDTVDEKDPQSLNQSDADGLMSWLQVLLTNKVQKIKVLYPSLIKIRMFIVFFVYFFVIH